MAFIDWLRKQHADSLRASQRLAADPFLKGVQPGANTAPAPQGAIPFQRTKPGFFARDYKKEDLVDNTLTMKNDGSETLVRKWKDPDQSALRVSGLGGSGGSHPVYQQPWLVRQAYFDNARRNQGLRDMVSAQEEGLQRGPPERVSQVDQIRRAIHEQPRSGSSIIDRPDISNIRAMHNAMQRPHPLVVGEEPQVGAWQSIMDRLNDSREQIRRRREQETMAPFDLFQRFGWRNN